MELEILTSPKGRLRGKYTWETLEKPQMDETQKKEKRPKHQRGEKAKTIVWKPKQLGVETDFINLGKLTPEVLVGKAQKQMDFR